MCIIGAHYASYVKSEDDRRTSSKFGKPDGRKIFNDIGVSPCRRLLHVQVLRQENTLRASS